MLKLSTSTGFRRDLKACQKRGYDLSLLEEMVNTLREPAPLSEKHHDHPLSGNWIGYQEAHI